MKDLIPVPRINKTPSLLKIAVIGIKQRHIIEMLSSNYGTW